MSPATLGTRMLTRIAAVCVVLTLAVTGAAFAAALKTGTKLILHSTSVGDVLGTGQGRTVYLNTNDGRNKSHCGDTCTTYWPPLLTKYRPAAGPGVHRSLLGTIKRGSKLQVTYNGHPLYTYDGDYRPSDANGEGHLHTWYVVTAAGKKK